MIDNDEYAIKLESAGFELTKVKINPAVLKQHNMTGTKTPAEFPIRRSEIKTFSILTGYMQPVRETLFSGQVQPWIVIGLVDTEAFTGKFWQNPSNFQHYDPKFLCGHVDGERFPSRPSTHDLTTDTFSKPTRPSLSGYAYTTQIAPSTSNDRNSHPVTPCVSYDSCRVNPMHRVLI